MQVNNLEICLIVFLKSHSQSHFVAQQRYRVYPFIHRGEALGTGMWGNENSPVRLFEAVVAVPLGYLSEILGLAFGCCRGVGHRYQ